MPVKVPGTTRRLIPDSHCIVTQDDSLSIERDFYKSVEPGELLCEFTSVFVVISGNGKDLLAPDVLSEFRSSRFRTDSEISQEVQNVVRFCTRVKAFENLLIHFLDSSERAIAVPNDILVTEMKIGCEPNVWH